MHKLIAVLTVSAISLTVPSAAEAGGYGCPSIKGYPPPHKVMESLFCSTKDLLRDPDTAKFRRLHLTRFPYTDGRYGWALCGEMNAKNAFGGFTGWREFAYTDAEHRILESTGMCRGNLILAGGR